MTCGRARRRGRARGTSTAQRGLVLGQGLCSPGCHQPSAPGLLLLLLLPQDEVQTDGGSASPRLHKDDVVESTASRPLHTVGTYCEAEPGQEGRGQVRGGIQRWYPPKSIPAWQ